MTDRDIVLQKTNSIQNCLKRIFDTVGDDLTTLDHLDQQDIVVLNLQRAVQLTIDMAGHVVASNNLGIPQTLKESFQLLEKQEIISKDLSQKMMKMVGFRNIAVHDYEAIDPEILKKIVSEHLQDLERFYEVILKL